MPVIDAHVHLYPPEINRNPVVWAKKAKEPGWATLATRIRKNGQPVQSFPSEKELLSAMDTALASKPLLGPR